MKTLVAVQISTIFAILSALQTTAQSTDYERKPVYVYWKNDNKPKPCKWWIDYTKLIPERQGWYADPKYDECEKWFLSNVPSKSPSPSMTPSLPPSSLPSLTPSQAPSFIPSTSPSEEPSLVPTKTPSLVPSSSPSSTPSSLPSIKPSEHHSQAPSSQPSSYPHSQPSVQPSDDPSQSPSEFPSISPSSMPNIHPSAYPTLVHSDQPSESPSSSRRPSSMEKVTVSLPEFKIALTFESNQRRMLSSSERQLSSTLVEEKRLFGAIFVILSNYYQNNLDDFFALDLRLSYDQTNRQYGSRSTQITVSYIFKGSVVLESIVHGLMDATEIPSESELQRKTLQAFSSVNGNIPSIVSDENPYTFRSWVVSRVKESTSGLNSEIKKSSGGTGPLVVTIVSSLVAIISTLTALGLIYKQTQNRGLEIANDSPQKQTGNEETISKARKFRSPFLNVTPPEGTRKYFSKLDDESVNSKAHVKAFNIEPSVMDSSFEESSYNGSLLAPSLASSKFAGQSLDVESLAGMSALDNVRLDSVLQLEDVQDNASVTSSDTGIFRKIWYGKRKPLTGGSIRKLTPPKKDTPTKQSPSKSSPGKAKQKTPKKDKPSDEKEEDIDDTSLLGDQSNKSEYYGQNEDSNLCYNMLGEQSVVSESSEDIDFNHLYNGDGVASSCGYSDNNSELEIMSRSSKLSSIHGIP